MVFSDLSIADSVSSWSWQFGDGAVSSIHNPTHIFESAGTYEVSLTISSLNCTDTFIRNMMITGNDSCTAGFDYQQTDPDIPEVNFYNQAPADSLLYFWDFGDGNFSNDHSPSHLYTDFGSYVVSLKILGYGCFDSVAETIVLVEPVYCGADFGFEQDFPQSRVITFTNQSFGNSISSVWDFGDGTVSTETDPVHEYESAGSFEVQLVITTSDSCTDSLISTVEILPPLMISGIVLAGESTLNSGNVLLYKTTNNTGVEWYGQQYLTDGSFSFTELSPGSYFLQAIPMFNFPFPMIPNYFPTYSGEEMKWQDAFVISTDILPLDVQLQLLHYNDFFDGKATLRGSVNAGPDRSENPLIIYLTNDEGQIMDSRLLDEELIFEFINIPYGPYKVYPEKAGKSGQPFSVELNESFPLMDDLVFIESADLIYPDLTGIDQLFAAYITISPNPVSEKLTVSFAENLDFSQCKLWVYGANGLSLPLSVNEMRKITIDVSEFPQGLYMLELTTVNTKILQKFLIQH
jgi:PKD repeat protein